MPSGVGSGEECSLFSRPGSRTTLGELNVVRGPSWLGNGHHFPDPTPKPRPQTHFLHILGHRMLLRERKCDFFAKRKCLGLRILPLSVSGCKWLKNTCCETNDYQLSPAAWTTDPTIISCPCPVLGGNCHKCLLATPLLLSTCIKIHQWQQQVVVGCWRGYLSGARCRLAYGPADATATHCLLLQ